MATVSVNIHLSVSPEVLGLITDVSRVLRALEAQGEVIMANQKSMQDSLDKINAATNNIAADITNLKSQIGTGMTQADVDAVQARLDSTVSQLEAIAAETPDASETPST